MAYSPGDSALSPQEVRHETRLASPALCDGATGWMASLGLRLSVPPPMGATRRRFLLGIGAARPPTGGISCT